LPDRQRWDGNEQATYDSGVSASHRALALGITTAILATSGAALYLWGEHLAHRAALTAAPTGDGAVVSLTYR
jgi:hypothetical protein